MNEGISNAILSGTLAVNVVSLLLGAISAKQFYLNQSVIFTALTTLDVIAHAHGVTYFDAVVAAVSVWLWWTNGGDDDTKRRLRRLKKTFTPVRRTAPAAA